MPAEMPQKIGRYEVVGKLGEGGMGVVYKARDVAIGRLVAIKMMTGGFKDNPELRERFTREARAAGNLQHANIVIIHELGEQEDAPYIVMEFLEGEALDHIIQSRREIPLAQKLEMMIQVCRALDYAHQRGIVHRDIKPANVMVLNQGGVKLVDFGIARLGAQKLTRTGTVIGTIHYMSPEQINAKPVDGRADVFSTGVMLYELLTGDVPFKGEDTTETMIKILTAAPAVDSLPGPQELRNVLDQALAKDRDLRYSSAARMADDLAAVRDALVGNATKTISRPAVDAAQTIVQGSVTPVVIPTAAATSAITTSAAATAPAMATPAQAAANVVSSGLSQASKQSAVTAAPAAPEKKKNRVNLMLAGSIFLVLLAIAGYVAYKKSAASPAATTPEQTAQRTPGTATPASSTTSTASTGTTTPPTNGNTAQISGDEAFSKGETALKSNDRKQAAEWYEKAANQNHAMAMVRWAGLLQFGGNGVNQDPVKAAALLQKAAALHEPSAMLQLARAYRDGNGISKDPVAAYAWFTVAMNSGQTAASGERDLMEPSLTKEQIEQATQKAKVAAK